MSIKKSLVLALVIVANTVVAQQSLNDYKYVLVPKKYDFLKYEDEYQLNSLTKFLFKKEGFETLFDNEIRPQELAINPCLGLISIVKNRSNLFSIKLEIELVNCRNETVFTSEVGRSSLKEYKRGYHEALRDAFKSISTLEYKYHAVEEPSIIKKEETVVQVEPAVNVKEANPVKKVVEAEEKPVAVIEEVVAVKTETVVEEVPFEVIEKAAPVEEEKIVTKQKINNVEQDITSPIILYAQVNETGFQLVDSTPKVVYILLKSSKKEVYFLKNKSGIVFKEDGKWFVEYYNGTTKIKDELKIKF